MQELVGGEGVVVDHPLAMRIVFEIGIGILTWRIHDIVVVAISTGIQKRYLVSRTR